MSADRISNRSDDKCSRWLHAGHELARAAGPEWPPNPPANRLPTPTPGCQTNLDRHPDRVSTAPRCGLVPSIDTSASVKSP